MGLCCCSEGGVLGSSLARPGARRALCVLGASRVPPPENVGGTLSPAVRRVSCRGEVAIKLFVQSLW